MAEFAVSGIESWHAHVYFDAASRDAAWVLREAVTAHFGDVVEMGRFHERPVASTKFRPNRRPVGSAG